MTNHADPKAKLLVSAQPLQDNLSAAISKAESLRTALRSLEFQFHRLGVERIDFQMTEVLGEAKSILNSLHRLGCHCWIEGYVLASERRK